jgi:hypothetical protein
MIVTEFEAVSRDLTGRRLSANDQWANAKNHDRLFIAKQQL